ncbi:MAG: DUF6046 domain-containing protein [Flavobacteriales bacterium]
MKLGTLNLRTHPETLAKSVGLQVLFSEIRNGKPFEVKGNIGPDGNPNFHEVENVLGNDWITSLAMRHEPSGIEFVFDECIISISQSKNILSTPMQGRNGTVKEYISDGDFVLSISAGIINELGNHAYPIEQVNELSEILLLNETIELQSDLLDVFDITNAVISSYSLTQETHSNRQSINIEMLSDEPFIIQLNDV